MHAKKAGLTTEYQRSYRPSLFKCATTTYRDNLDFRLQQQRRFQGHVPDPFQWDDDFDDDDDGSDVESCESPCRGRGPPISRPPSVPAYQYKHNKWNRLYEERAVRGAQCWNNQERDAGRSVRTVERHDVDDGCSSLAGTTQDDDADERSVVHIVGPSGSCCDSEDSVSNKQTQTPTNWCCVEKAPFAMYGRANVNKQTGGKLTYNVKATRQIHPSAVRASHSRQQKSNRPSDACGCCNPSAITSAARLGRQSTPLVVRADQSPSTGWQTEYDSEYRPYEKSRYRVQAENGIRPHSADLQSSSPSPYRCYHRNDC